MAKKIKIPKSEKLEKYNSFSYAKEVLLVGFKKSYDKLRERDLEV